jgi:nucleotide-binding universal stress UspA family protein
MMVQSILVGMDVSEAVDEVTSVATQLAVILEAGVKAVYIEDTALVRATTLSSGPPLPPGGTIPLHPEATRELEQRFQKEEWILGTRFLELVSDTRIRGSFLVERGEVPSILVRESRAHDLMVLGKFGESQSGTQKKTPPLGGHIEDVVRHAYCPVMLVPPGAELGQRFLIAYDGSAVAHRALAMASRLGRATGAELTVLVVAGEEPGDRIIEEAGAYLEAHEISAALHRREGDAAEVILEEANGWGASLIAMGAFGHGRLRQLLGAAATHSILRGLDRVALLCGAMESG